MSRKSMEARGSREGAESVGVVEWETGRRMFERDCARFVGFKREMENTDYRILR
jgi:hypothetical protein